jgi:hypothetical protein
MSLTQPSGVFHQRVERLLFLTVLSDTYLAADVKQELNLLA